MEEGWWVEPVFKPKNLDIFHFVYEINLETEMIWLISEAWSKLGYQQNNDPKYSGYSKQDLWKLQGL